MEREQFYMPSKKIHIVFMKIMGGLIIFSANYFSIKMPLDDSIQKKLPKLLLMTSHAATHLR